MISCIKRPLIGISGQCGYTGTSGLSLDQIHISLRKVANVTDDQLKGSQLIEVVETSAINRVINDLKLILAKEFAFQPIFDVVQKPWQGKISDCNIYRKDNPIGLKIETHCKDEFRSNRLDWIELQTDNAFNVTAVIQDGAKVTEIDLHFDAGYNRKEINYTFETKCGKFWMRLCNHAGAYENKQCGCNSDGHCGCNKCANVYAIEMVEGGEIECVELTEEELIEQQETQGYGENAKPGNLFLEPKCQASEFNVFGYQVSCLCSYDWLFCLFQNELAQAVLIQMGIQIYEKVKFTERFNLWVEAAKDQADYFLDKFNGPLNQLTGKKDIGEYNGQLKLIADMMKNYIVKSGTECLPCKQQVIIQNSF